jgi:SPP1 gp7 family putative phage head morphogenesis protein
MNRDLWRVSFGNELAKQERKQASKFRAYLKQNYNTAIDQAIERQGMQSLDGLFQEAELKNLYIDLYRTIGTRFALWYQDAYKKLIKKNGDRTTWAETFAGVGEREAGRKIVIVQGTAKKEVQRVLGRLFKDPDFTAQGAEVQGRILRQQFNQISQYQAERIVRTETTNAANQGVMKSATDLFGKNNLQKEWIASLDERTRGTHAAVNGTVVEYDEAFSVGGDLMQHPADPAGRASNVINCRCSIALIPKADAELQEGVELEGFGGALAARASRLVGDELVTAAKPTKEVVEEVAEERQAFKTRAKAQEYVKSKLGVKVSNFKGLDMKIVNEYVDSLERLKGSFKGFQLNSFSSLAGHREELVNDIFSRITKTQKYKEEIERGWISKKRIDDRIKSRIKKQFRLRKQAVASYRHTPDIYNGGYNLNYNISKYRGIVHEETGSYAVQSADGADMVRIKWWSQGADKPAHTALHEIGHALDYQIMFHKEPELLKYVKSIRAKGEEFRSTRSRRGFMANTYVRDNLSEYASMNEKEIIAESVAEYFASDAPRQISRDVTEMLMRYWKKKVDKKNRSRIKDEDDLTDRDIIPFGGVHKPSDEYVDLPESLDL